jgi:hypothetical protein
MTERAKLLVEVVMDMISGACDTMDKDHFYSPPKWILENWWATLNLVRGEITSKISEDPPVDDSDVQVP